MRCYVVGTVWYSHFKRSRRLRFPPTASIAPYHIGGPGQANLICPPQTGFSFPPFFSFSLTCLVSVHSLTFRATPMVREGRKEGFLLEVQFYENGRGYYSVD